MLSRRTLLTLGLSRAAARVEQQLDAARLDPPPPPPAAPPSHYARLAARPRGAPPPRPAWPHRQGAQLWAPVSRALPRPAGARLLEADELDCDLASLPLGDGEFDVAVSAFAVMFSSDPAAAIGELARVVRPGGVVAFTAWTPAGIVGRLLRLAEEHDPPPPGAPLPMDWGREERLRRELERHSDAFELRPGGLTLTFASRDEALDRLFASLRPLAWCRQADELRRLAAQIVAGETGSAGGAVALRATYVEVLAERRPA